MTSVSFIAVQPRSGRRSLDSIQGPGFLDALAVLGTSLRIV